MPHFTGYVISHPYLIIGSKMGPSIAAAILDDNHGKELLQ